MVVLLVQRPQYLHREQKLDNGGLHEKRYDKVILLGRISQPGFSFEQSNDAPQ